MCENVKIDLMSDVVTNLNNLSIELFSKCLDFEYENDSIVKCVVLLAVEGDEFSDFKIKELDYKDGYIDIYNFITPDFFTIINNLKLIDGENGYEILISYKPGDTLYKLFIVTNKEYSLIKDENFVYDVDYISKLPILGGLVVEN